MMRKPETYLDLWLICNKQKKRLMRDFFKSNGINPARFYSCIKHKIGTPRFRMLVQEFTGIDHDKIFSPLT